MMFNFAAEKQTIAEGLGYRTIEDAIIGEYKTGTLRSVARIFGVTPGAIRYCLLRLGVETKPLGGRNNVRRCMVYGRVFESVKSASEYHEVSDGTICVWCRNGKGVYL